LLKVVLGIEISFIVGATEYFSCYHCKELIETVCFENLKRNISAK
jgi:hypothetical protein